MNNPIGIITAITTLLSIWFGHVMVRKWEARVVRIGGVITVCLVLGLLFEAGAMLVDSNQNSAILGIVGIIFLWDGLEFYRQQKRVKNGHAPANPENQRHAQILVQYPSATTVDLAGREPRGKPYTKQEIDTLFLKSDSTIGER